MRTDPAGVRTGFVALLISTIAGLVAGVVLGSVTKTLLLLPGLIVLEPAAIGLRGNVFGGLASRLSTMAQLGDMKFSRRASTPVGQNLWSSIILSLSCSLILAGIAKIVSEAFGITRTIGFTDFFLISILGGLIPTILTLLATIFLARLCVRREWDLDNVGAPLITAVGDMLTIPSLLLATKFVGHGWISSTFSALLTFASIILLVIGLWSRYDLLRRIVRESLPILITGGSVSILAGLFIQGKLSSLSALPILLAFVPPLLSTNGAIGSILSARIATKLHLGIVRSDKFSFSPVSEDFTVAYLITIPIFLALGIFCSLYSTFGHLHGPGWVQMIAVALIAGIGATTLSNILGYITAVLTYRFGLDPDNFAVPAVTSGSDLIGVVVLMTTIGILRI